LAQRIVTWRTERGAFGGFERLDSVPGIGPKLLEGLRPYAIFSSGLARDGLTLPPAR
jgi:DNA uptake protein ComE-like DNA-binding protein